MPAQFIAADLHAIADHLAAEGHEWWAEIIEGLAREEADREAIRLAILRECREERERVAGAKARPNITESAS